MSGSGTKTFSISLDGPVNALAINKEANFVAVAGRNVFKIFQVKDDAASFLETLNLRVGKHLNLNFSTNDVAWNQLEEDVLATAATNGAVVIWNLQKSSKSKMDILYQNHKRTVNKVCFHPNDPNILLSGSQDGTMKLFDLRKRDVSNTFESHSESVRDVKFSPFRESIFSAVQENGNVQIWDLRKCEKYERQFTAHNGPVLSCDWHPEERKWLATAGRDKTIKIWDSTRRPVSEFTIQTIAPVSNVKWQPQEKYNLASSSLVVDFSVYVWNIQRPYVPFAAFMEHKDVTTAFSWRNVSDVLISAGKDGTLYHHVFKDAQRPANHINKHALDMNSQGDICYAVSNSILKHKPSSSNSNSLSSNNSTNTMLCSNNAHFKNNLNISNQSNNPNSTSTSSSFSSSSSSSSSSSIVPFLSSDNISLFKKFSDLKSNKFKCPSSSMLIYKNQNAKKCLSMDWFVISALRYRLTGKSLSDLCDHNAEVATHLNRPQIAQTWRILKQLYGGIRNGTFSNIFNNLSNEDKQIAEFSENKLLNRPFSKSLINESKNSTLISSFSNINSLVSTVKPFYESIDKINSLHEIEQDSNDKGENVFYPHLYSHPADNQIKVNEFFSADEDNLAAHTTFTTAFEMTPTNTSLNALNEYNLSLDTFRNIDDLDDCILLSNINHLNEQNNPAIIEDSTLLEESNNCDENNPSMVLPALPPKPVWKFNDIVIDMLHFYANQGDIQTTVSAIAVLGDRLKNLIDEFTQEFWFNSYIELLSRYQLWNVVNQIIRISSNGNINSINQTSTSVYLGCGSCRKTLTRKLIWFCDRCNIVPSLCSICNGIVKGIYAWCQGCSHGGHVHHIQDWLKISRYCPTGCGHLCEFS